MTKKIYSRYFQTLGLYMLCAAPSLGLAFPYEYGIYWISYLLLPYAVFLFIVIVREHWMAVLRSKFSAVSLYGIRLILTSFIIISLIFFSLVVTGRRTDDYSELEAALLLLAIALGAVAIVGSLIEGLLDVGG